MDAREFQEWQEYYRLEPWGDDWMQTGLIVSSNANLWSKRKYKPEQFIPRAKQRKTPEQMEAEMMQWARLHNARIEREEARKKHGNHRPD